jgi:hypothetical protein
MKVENFFKNSFYYLNEKEFFLSLRLLTFYFLLLYFLFTYVSKVKTNSFDDNMKVNKRKVFEKNKKHLFPI